MPVANMRYNQFAVAWFFASVPMIGKEYNN